MFMAAAKRTIGNVLLVFCLYSNAYGQVVIQESALTDLIGTTRSLTLFSTESGDNLGDLVSASGENQQWDFSLLSYADTSQFEQSHISLPADLPGSDLPELTVADFVEYTTGVSGSDTLKTLLYQSLDNGTIRGHGALFIGKVDGVQDTLVTLASPPENDGVLPFEYQKTWRDSTTFVFQGEPVPTYVITEVTVDGWGMLITPSQTAPALRLFNSEKTYLMSDGSLLAEDVSIDFISAEGVTAEIEFDESMNPINASYAVAGETMPTSVERLDESIPDAYVLEQNYPNPFNPSTTITYSIKETTGVQVSIYSLTGKHITTLVHEVQPAGSYEVSFDAKDLASGTYIYRLRAGSYSEIKLMSFVK